MNRVKEDILGMLLNELALTRQMMLDLLRSPILTAEGESSSIPPSCRADALLPLHREQVPLAGSWRKAQKGREMQGSCRETSAEPASQCECHCQCHGYHGLTDMLYGAFI